MNYLDTFPHLTSTTTTYLRLFGVALQFSSRCFIFKTAELPMKLLNKDETTISTKLPVQLFSFIDFHGQAVEVRYTEASIPRYLKCKPVYKSLTRICHAINWRTSDDEDQRGLTQKTKQTQTTTSLYIDWSSQQIKHLYHQS